MATLPSGLTTLSTNTVGWNAPMDANIELIDERLVEMFLADEVPGTSSITTVPDGSAEALTDSTTGTPTNTINDVGASFSQSTLNDNFASLVDEINKLRSDLVALQTSYNTLLSKLRKTGGVGVLAD